MKNEKHLRLEATLRAEARDWQPIPSADFNKRLAAALASARHDTAAQQATSQTSGWFRSLWLPVACAGLASALALGMAWQQETLQPQTIHQTTQISAITANPPPDVGRMAREFKERLGLSPAMSPMQQEVLASLPLVLPTTSLGNVVALPLQAFLAADKNTDTFEHHSGEIGHGVI